MKNITLTLIMIFTIATYTSAQGKKPVEIEGKPSYTETTDFIKTHFAGSFFTDGERFSWGYAVGKDNYLGHYYKITVIEFTDSCQAKFAYEIKEQDVQRLRSSTQTIRRSIDLSQVESISIQGIGKEIGLYGMMFNVKNVAKREEMDLPFARMKINNGDSDENFKTLEEGKIYKAFNHLRKLCGAPEPINFN